ncbi:hypothetical protein [Lysinibacillus pakistanensis]
MTLNRRTCQHCYTGISPSLNVTVDNDPFVIDTRKIQLVNETAVF